MSPEPKSFSIRHLPSLLWETAKAWYDDDPFRQSAVVAYYAVISLPALIIIIINLVGWVWGYEIVQGHLTDEISAALGRDSAEAIQTMIAETRQSDQRFIASVFGIGTLLFGATGVFFQIKVSLNNIWKIEPKPSAPFFKVLIDRLLSFAFIVIIGFLLLISFLVTAAINGLNNFISSKLPDFMISLAYALDVVSSLGIITLLFALIFRYLPDAKVRWKTVWIGSVITAVLFVFGKFLLGYYFGQVEPGSTYGAAGIIVLVLLWVSYSSLIVFFGAEFTYVYAKRYGKGIEPTKLAKIKSQG